MKVKPHEIYKIDDNGTPIEAELLATIMPAPRESVDLVLSQSEDELDGRSNWVWVRLQDGTLILGVFPQGDTYFATEKDHS